MHIRDFLLLLCSLKRATLLTLSSAIQLANLIGRVDTHYTTDKEPPFVRAPPGFINCTHVDRHVGLGERELTSHPVRVQVDAICIYLPWEDDNEYTAIYMTGFRQLVEESPEEIDQKILESKLDIPPHLK